MAKQVPIKDGEQVLLCSHLTIAAGVDNGHFFRFNNPTEVVGTEVGVESVTWVILCEKCFADNPQLTTTGFSGDVSIFGHVESWHGRAPEAGN